MEVLAPDDDGVKAWRDIRGRAQLDRDFGAVFVNGQEFSRALTVHQKPAPEHTGPLVTIASAQIPEGTSQQLRGGVAGQVTGGGVGGWKRRRTRAD